MLTQEQIEAARARGRANAKRTLAAIRRRQKAIKRGSPLTPLERDALLTMTRASLRTGR